MWQRIIIDALCGINQDSAKEDKKIRKVMKSLKEQNPKLSRQERRSRAIAILKKQGSISKSYGNK